MLNHSVLGHGQLPVAAGALFRFSTPAGIFVVPARNVEHGRGNIASVHFAAQHGRSPSPGPHHVDKEHAEAAEQQNSAAHERRGRHKKGINSGDNDDRDDGQRQRAIIDEQSDEFLKSADQ